MTERSKVAISCKNRTVLPTLPPKKKRPSFRTHRMNSMKRVSCKKYESCFESQPILSTHRVSSFVKRREEKKVIAREWKMLNGGDCCDALLIFWPNVNGSLPVPLDRVTMVIDAKLQGDRFKAMC